MLKKIISILLLISSAVLLFACGNEYPPVESTEEEKQVIMTLSLAGEEYEVKYELYRALFLSLAPKYSEGGIDENEAEEINTQVICRAANIYSAFAVARSIGIDPYSKDYNKLVKECVYAGVNGGTVGAYTYVGFGGDYDKYLASLKAMNINYSVQDLMLRYALIMDDIYYYYKGDIDGDATLGHIKYTKDDVLRFYNSTETSRVMQLFLSTRSTSYTYERAEEIRDEIASKGTDTEVLNTMMKYSISGDVELALKNGTVISSHNLDSYYYRELIDAAAELSNFETSEVIEVTTSEEHGYFILYKFEKSDEHFEDCYETIRDVYLENEIGKIIDNSILELEKSAKFSNAFELLDYNNIKMD